MINKSIAIALCSAVMSCCLYAAGCSQVSTKYSDCISDTCKDAQTLLKCDAAAGIQTEIPCPYGCADGKCAASAEKCSVNYCKDAQTLLKCDAALGIQTEMLCPNGCEAGKCMPDPVKCTADVCKDAKTLFKCDVSAGVQTEVPCPNKCDGGKCKNFDEKCTSDVCKDVQVLLKCDAVNGIQTETPCPYGCDGGKCSPEPVKCTSDVCKDAQTLLKCDVSVGVQTEMPCPYGCDGVKCRDKSEQNLLETLDIAPSFKGKTGDALYDYLGSRLVDEGVNFAVYADHASRVEVLLFDNPEDDPIERIPMKRDDASGIWTVYVKNLGIGTKYGYIAFGPNWPYQADFKPGTSIGFISDCDAQGNRYNPNKLLIDPYTRRLHADFKFELGSPLSGAGRDECDWKAAPKSIVTKSEYIWSEAESVWRENRKKGDAFSGHAANEMIIYEVHPKGFTQNANDLDEALRGTWQGIGEKAQYLADLGITAVELLPVAEKNTDGTYWGYDSIAYFAPEMSYATKEHQKSSSGVIDEFKWMVDKLHQAGIEVILDVVYGQTGESGFWPEKLIGSNYSYPAIKGSDDNTALALYSFRGLDNKSYYHLVKGADSGTENLYYLNQTGVGNQTRSNIKPFRRLIMDNLHYWSEEMHVDGFRIDLASVLGVLDEQVAQDGDSKNFDNGYWMNHVDQTVLQDMIDDERLSAYHTRIIAEPWSMSQFVIGGFPKSKNGKSGWYEWNGRFRDIMKSLVNDDEALLSKRDTIPPDWEEKFDIGNAFTGSSSLFGDDGRNPYHSINYVTSHDGFTMYDLMSYQEKNNGCSKINQICCDNPLNQFCKLNSGSNDNRSRNWCRKNCSDDVCDENVDVNGRCKDDEHERLKRQMIRNMMALMILSHGTPMILGGDEYMRTQFGNNDAFSNGSDNEWNWFRWNDWATDAERVRMHDYVRDLIKIRKQYQNHLSPTDYNSQLKWISPVGIDTAWNGKSIGMYYQQNGQTPSFLVLINMEPNLDREFQFPESGEWNVLLDTQLYFEQEQGKNTWFDGSRKVSNSYGVKARSIVVAAK